MVYDENTSFGNNILSENFFFVSSKILIKAFTEAHRKTIFVSNVSRNFKKKVASVIDI